MELYVAQYACWEEFHVIGVFSSQDKAEKAIENFITDYRESLNDEDIAFHCEIKELELDRTEQMPC